MPIKRCLQVGVFVFILFALRTNPAWATTCSGTCAVDGDCVGACVFCNTDFNVCADCCDFETALCPSACTVVGNECRNAIGTACIGVPETPQSFRIYFFGALFLMLLAAGWYGKLKLARKPAGRE